jgi:hypothetical protein
MSNYHYERWLLKIIMSFLLIAGSLFFMYYSFTFLKFKENWVLFGLITSLSAGIGALLLSSATINKVKSDLIKKQKVRQQSGG